MGSTNPLFLEQVVVGFELLHLSKSSLYFWNFRMAWILWVLGACFVGNIALEVFPAFLLRQPIGNTLKALSYILQFGQIHFAIWTNIFTNSNQFSFQLRQMNFTICKNKIDFHFRQPIGNTLNLKALTYILQFGRKHFVIWTNTFSN